ncbi:glycosyltransferase [Planctomycetota bacterium]
MSSPNADVTLVVPARDRPALTERLLDSLRRSEAKYPIVVVDDGSASPLVTLRERSLDLRLTVVRNKQAVGPAAARNVGLWRAQTPYVAFTDNDVAVTATWMNELLGHLKAAPSDVAGVGGRVTDDGTTLIGNYATQLGLLNPFVYQGRVAYLVTANCVFRRDALLEIGGFDESFATPGGEDAELSFRLLQNGYRLEYQPAAVVEHHYEASWIGFYNLFWRYGRGCRKAMETLRTPPTAVGCSPAGVVSR